MGTRRPWSFGLCCSVRSFSRWSGLVRSPWAAHQGLKDLGRTKDPGRTKHEGPRTEDSSTAEQTHYLTPAGTPASGNWRTNQFKARDSPGRFVDVRGRRG